VAGRGEILCGAVAPARATRVFYPGVWAAALSTRPGKNCRTVVSLISMPCRSRIKLMPGRSSATAGNETGFVESIEVDATDERKRERALPKIIFPRATALRVAARCRSPVKIAKTQFGNADPVGLE